MLFLSHQNAKIIYWPTYVFFPFDKNLCMLHTLIEDFHGKRKRFSSIINLSQIPYCPVAANKHNPK